MTRSIALATPFDAAQAEALHAGDEVLLSGVVYTARDAAHERLAEMLAAGRALPVDLRNQVIYYCGPTPARPGRPTTSTAHGPCSVSDRPSIS